MKAIYKYEANRFNSVFDGLPGKRRNSPNLDKMRFSYKVWKDPEDKIIRIMLVWLAPETDKEQASLDRIFKKLKSKGTLTLVSENKEDNTLNINN